jgi:hypothetical protein
MKTTFKQRINQIYHNWSADVWLLGTAQGLDALVTWLGVTSGLLRETNPLLVNVVQSGWFIPVKATIGAYFGYRLKGSRALKIIIGVSFLIVTFNIGGIIWKLTS